MKFLAFFFFFTNTIFAQIVYPSDYFSPPLEIPMQLSGNFGELRPNHFHAGFDLKTMQKEGLAVHAVANGYISRIKISTFGNGKTIYITHPNGFTSVYGHLQKANDSIERFIKKNQYKEQSFEVELFLKPNEMLVNKGQLIAFSGNTGASEGPHLHFEIRDSQSEKIINPLFFGFDKYFKDSQKPVISGLYAYPLDNNSVVNHSKQPLLLNLSLQKDGTYLSEKVVSNGKIGFGVATFDFDDVSFNKNGVFKIQSFYNGKENFGYQFDTYSFDEMRYVNALIDYERYKKTNQRIQKLFMKNEYGLSIIKTDENQGVFSVQPNLNSVCRIEVSDFYGNKTTVSIPIKYDTQQPIIEKEPFVSNYFIKAAKDSNFAKDNISVFFPAGTFYDDFNLIFDVKKDTLYLNKDTVPVHSSFTVTIEDNKFSDAQREKVFIGLIEKNKNSYNPTFRKGNVFTAKSKIMGNYALILDTIAPKITILKPIEGKWLSNQKSVELSINDSLSGIKSYSGFLNNKWILFEYDNKKHTITHDFKDGIVAEGANDLKVIVSDNVGNSTIFETHFFRSQKQ